VSSNLVRGFPNWKGYVVKHNYVNKDVLMTIPDNYMFRPLLAIFRLSLRELKILLYIMCARVMERSLHLGCVIVNHYVQCGGVLCTIGSGG